MVHIANMIGKVMTGISIALMVLLCVPITYEAVARFFNAPTLWVFETTLYAFIFLGFLGNALAVKSGSHFRVTLLVDMFPASKPFFDRLSQIMTLAFALLIISSGIYFVSYSYTSDILSATMLEIPLWIPQLAIPLGGFGLLLQTLVTMITGEEPGNAHMAGD